MKINATEIRVGMKLEYKNDLWEVLKTQHVKPGKGGAFAQIEMKSLNKNTKLNERFRSSETIEKATLEETKFNFLYEDDTDYYFINPKTFNQINIKKNIIGQKGKMLTENLEVSINFYNENPLSVDLPNQITSKVENLGLIEPQLIRGNKIYKPNMNEAALLSFYQNNISHFFLIYSLICLALKYVRYLSIDELFRLVNLVYPFLESDAHLSWDKIQINDVSIIL